MGNNNGKHAVEISLLEKRMEKIEEARELAENIIDAVRDPMVVLDGDLKVLSVNKSFYDTFVVRPGQTVGRFLYDLGDRQWDIPKLRRLLEDILPNNASFNDYVIEQDFPNIGRRMLLLNARRIPRPPAKPKIILFVMEDITDLDKARMTFEKMLEYGIFSKASKEKEESIIALRKEVNVLLKRLGEKLKYTNGKG